MASAARVALHEIAERHRRRARGLAAPALHALLHRVAELVVDGRPAELDRPHRGDAARAATRSRGRSPGTSGSAAGRARRRRRRPARRRRSAERSYAEGDARTPSLISGRRPGFDLPVGSNARIRPSTARWAARGRSPSSAGAAASRSSQPRRLRGGARAEQAVASSAATCTVPTPASASHRRRERVERAATRGRPRRRDRTRPGGPAGHGGGRRRASPPAAPAASTSAGWPSSSTIVRRAVPGIADGQADEPRATDRRRRVAPRVAAPRSAPQRHLGHHAERAERTDEQPGHVVAGHVLDRRPAALHQSAVGGDEAHLEDPVAQRARRAGAGARQSRREHAADGRRGVRGSSGHSWPVSASAADELATVVPAPTVTVRSAGSYRTIPAGAGTWMRLARRRAADRPLRAGAPTGTTARAADDRGRVR